MGQRTVGILYGCEAPDLPGDPDMGPAEELIDRWEKAKKIDRYHGGLHVRHENEGGISLLGVWVAVGGSGKDGVPNFLARAVAVAEINVPFAREIGRARKLWRRFAAWCEKKEGIELPPPKLWLTPTETA